MEDIKLVIAKNISELRSSFGMTQIDLAEKLHYSDKAVSKWERGESVPEIGTITAIADLFGVPVDYLVRSEHKPSDPVPTTVDERRRRNRALITGMSVLLVWLVSTLVFVIIDIVSKSTHIHWLSYVYAVPASMVVWLVFNSIWFNRRRNYLIISLLMWSFLAALHVTFLLCGANIWQIYALGVPGQIIILMWSRMKFKKER